MTAGPETPLIATAMQYTGPVLIFGADLWPQEDLLDAVNGLIESPGHLRDNYFSFGSETSEGSEIRCHILR